MRQVKVQALPLLLEQRLHARRRGPGDLAQVQTRGVEEQAAGIELVRRQKGVDPQTQAIDVAADGTEQIALVGCENRADGGVEHHQAGPNAGQGCLQVMLDGGYEVVTQAVEVRQARHIGLRLSEQGPV